MNPDTSKSSMTVNSLMQWGVAISIAVPIILFALLAFISLNADHNAFEAHTSSIEWCFKCIT